MIRPILRFTACLILIGATSCHTSRKATVAHKKSPPSQPKFIGDIYMSPHQKNSATSNAIAKKSKDKKYDPSDPFSTRDDDDNETHYTKASYKAPKASEDNDNSERETEHFSRRDINSICKRYAEILGISQRDITNYALYRFIDKWYGANYRLGGSDKSGIDCSGFAQKLYSEVYGIDLLRTAMEQFQSCKRVKKSKDAEEGDLVFFKQNSRHITHVGVYLANDFFVHSSTSQGVIISSLHEEYWEKHYAGMGRVPRS